MGFAPDESGWQQDAVQHIAMTRIGTRLIVAAALLVASLSSGETVFRPAAAAAMPTSFASSVHEVRLPTGGVQPAVAVEAGGMIHLVYLAGPADASDVLYMRSADGGMNCTPPVRVNSQPGSAIAVGTIRGPAIAVGADGRVHVVWNGSDRAEPRAPVNPATGRPGSPLLYARSNESRTAFTPQRNLITHTTDLDGGSAVAADNAGAVYVVWHGGPASGAGDEAARRVWISRSLDGGGTFDEERAIAGADTGVCGCCALHASVTHGDVLHVLYRSATAGVHRDVYSLVSRDRGRTFASTLVDRWEIGACPMTSMSIAAAGDETVRAWETGGQVYYQRVGEAKPSSPGAGGAGPRKHPRVAVDARGMMLLVWTEGTSWGHGGAVAWQRVAPDGTALGRPERKADLPAWSFAVVAPLRTAGRFTIFY